MFDRLYLTILVLITLFAVSTDIDAADHNQPTTHELARQASQAFQRFRQNHQDGLGEDAVYSSGLYWFSVQSIDPEQHLMARQQAIAQAHQRLHSLLLRDFYREDVKRLGSLWPQIADLVQSRLRHVSSTIPLEQHRLVIAVRKADVALDTLPQLGPHFAKRTWTQQPAAGEASLSLSSHLNLMARRKALLEAPQRSDIPAEMKQVRAILLLRQVPPKTALVDYAKAQVALTNRFEAEQALAILNVYAKLTDKWQPVAASLALGASHFPPLSALQGSADHAKHNEYDSTHYWLSQAQHSLAAADNHQALLAARRALALGISDHEDLKRCLILYAKSAERIGLSHSYQIIYNELVTLQRR